MNHLPPVANPWKPTRVPFFGGVFQGGSFIDYPADQGWNLKHLQQGIFAEDQREDAACFVQEWLFFGLMETVLRIEVDPCKLLDMETGDETTYVSLTTEYLLKYMDEWKAWLKLQSPEELLDYQAEVAACIRFSYEAWCGFKNFPLVAGGPEGIESGQAVDLSICILGTTLENALIRLQVMNSGLSSWRKARSNFLVTRMLDEGWCPSTIEHINAPLHNTTLYYASLLGPPLQPRGYENAPLRHTQCKFSDLECRRRMVKDDAYETAHHTPDCHCAFVGPTKEKLSEIIGTKDPYSQPSAQLGSIPLVYWNEEFKKLETVPYTPDKQYTAISHVWSDGMGNMKENSLPICQIERITSLIKAIPWTEVSVDQDHETSESIWKRADKAAGPTYDFDKLDKQPKYFWMDTLCVPCSEGDLDRTGMSLRKIAIIGMRAIYARANRVLVFDSDLMSKSGVVCEEELLVRIFASTWNRRLWTLQEYALAKTVWYVFEDRISSVNGRGEKEEEIDADWNNEILYYAKQRDSRMFAKTKELTSIPIYGDTLKVLTVWTNLRSRCTKRLADVPICVSMLLDMDLLDLMSVPIEDRLAKHWSMYQYIPAGLLMLPGVKQEKYEVRWAPLYMTECVNMPNPQGHPIIRMPNGRLALTLHGVTIDRINGGATGRRTVIPLTIAGEIWYLRQNLQRGNRDWSAIDFRKEESYALIVGEDLLTVNRPMQMLAYLVALVRVTSIATDRSMNVEWLNASSLVKRGSPWDAPAQWTAAQLEEKRLPPVTAAYTPTDQWWHIS